MQMKTVVKSLISLTLFFMLVSFSWPKGIFNGISPDSTKVSMTKVKSVDEVIITYEKPDVCHLNYLGDIKVTEKFLFFINNGLKSSTITKLKKLAFEKGGSIVYVYTDLHNGVGIGFTRTISACVFTPQKPSP